MSEMITWESSEKVAEAAAAVEEEVVVVAVVEGEVGGSSFPLAPWPVRSSPGLLSLSTVPNWPRSVFARWFCLVLIRKFERVLCRSLNMSLLLSIAMEI